MANHKAAKKSIRQIAKRTIINKSRVSRIRTYIRKFEQSVLGGDEAAVIAAFRTAQREIMSGVSKGVLHKNTAARKISRLHKRVKALSA